MKTKPFIQNQLTAHTGDEENLDVNLSAEHVTGEIISKEAVRLDDLTVRNLSSPFDLFENVSTGSNSIEDRNRGVTNSNLPHSEPSPES